MLTIQRLYINYNKSVRTQKIQFLVIHDCGAVSTARNNRDYFAGANREASADFFVDSTNIIQTMDYNKNYSWNIGDGHGKYGKTNSNVIGIEMCLQSNMQPTEQTIQNTLDLTHYLMKELGISATNVVRHFDCSGKICPGSFSANNWAKWTDFKKRLVASIPSTPTETYEVRLSYNNVKSQLISTTDYQQAKDIANAHPSFSVYDSKGKNLYILKSSPIPETYRIRKTYADEKSQIGDVYTDLYQAKDFCNQHFGYSVFNSEGKNLYTLAIKPVVSPTITKTTTVELNVRSSASTTSSILGLLPKGTSVKILGSLNGFYEILYNGKNCYVSEQYVK